MRSKDRKIDYSLKLCREVLGLPAFHFGYFDETRNRRETTHGTDTELTIDDLKQAQLKYTEKLLNYIPENVETILDVGCGTGISTEMLISKGLNVECLSPDLYNQQIITEKFKDAVKFHLIKFEEFSTDKKYNLVLMSESSQYISLKILFYKCKETLTKNGYILLSDYFRKEPTSYYRNCAVLSEFLEEAEKNNFKILKSEDITENILPTLSLGNYYYQHYAIPILESLISLANDELPKTTKIIKVLFKQKIYKQKKRIYEKYPEMLDTEQFRKNLKYMIYLFRKGRETNAE
ncbi:MAG: methyltransferase domain-containing protein [Elusimicrobiota bacterium]